MGYATEALEAVMDFAFSACKAQELRADHYQGNEASGRVMEKAGMIYQGTIPAKYTKNGISYDAPQYRITCSQRKDKSISSKLDSIFKI